MEPRPGWGERHPALAALLEHDPAVATEDVVWGDGVEMRSAVHLGAISDLRDELITSVRCVVFVGDRLVVCTNANGGSHALPGGRREPGESLLDTVCREVHEETGWQLDRSTMRPVGWLHFEYRSPVAPAWAHLPHPDFLHVVFAGEASARAAEEWSDTEGFEISSQLLRPAEAIAAVTGCLDRPLIERATTRR